MTVLDDLRRLPHLWHAAGSLPMPALEALYRHTSSIAQITLSVETGCGKSTLLFSHVSPLHMCFTVGERAEDDSLAKVLASPLLNNDHVRWIIGPTQRTLPRYEFTEGIDISLIDGPHAYPYPQIEYWCLYPHLKRGGLLVIDDIQIPTVFHLFSFLREEPMFELLEVVGNTAFFQRTEAPLFNPDGDAWEIQAYNMRRTPIFDFRTDLRPPWATHVLSSLTERMRRTVPPRLKAVLKRYVHR